MKKTVVLFSGGIDSTTALYWALSRYDQIFALTFDYGQRHRAEIALARRLARRIGVVHRVLRVNLNQVGGSALTDRHIPLPRYKTLKGIGKKIPATYVPFRNGIFLALAAAWAEVQGVRDIVCGFHVLDSPCYPDTSREFVLAIEKAINAGTRAAQSPEKVRILAPFINNRKSEIIREGLRLGADYSFSISCYSGEEVPCGRCSSCLLRRQAWRELRLGDPLIVRLRKEGRL
jgi:7-cyano-7-deazaguanine synthase